MTGVTSTSTSVKSSPPSKAEVSTVAETESPKKNLRLFHVEGATASIEESTENYQAASMIAVGADASSVSMLALMVNLFLAITCLKAPAFIERIGLSKKGALVLALMNSFTWLPLIMVYMIFKDTISPVWFIFLWLLNIIPGMLLSTQRDNWISSLVSKDVMGSYLGRRMAIKSTFYLGAFFTLGLILDNYGESATTGFTVIFCIALVATFIYFGIYCLMKETKHGIIDVNDETTRTFGVFNFFKELKERKLTKYILFTSLFSVSVSLCGPLYSFYMLNELGFSYILFTTIIAIEYLARIIGVPFWGHIADKYGNIKVLNIVTRIIPFLPICWLFSPNPGFLILIQAISGVCWGAYDLCTQNYLFALAPAKTKLRYIIYNKSLTLFCMAAGGLLSIFLLKGIFPLGGSKILSIFLISGVFRGIVALFLVPKLVDFAVSVKSGKTQAVIDEDILNAASSKKSGLYYQPSLWERYSNNDKYQLNPVFMQEMDAEVSTGGLYYKADQWKQYGSKEKKKTHSKMYTEIKGVISTAGLYYHPEKWMKEYSRTVMMPAGILQETGNISASQALYYNPTAWQRYTQNIAQQQPEEVKIHTISYEIPAAMKANMVSQQQPEEIKIHTISYEMPVKLKTHTASQHKPAEIKKHTISHQKPVEKKTDTSSTRNDRQYKGTLNQFQMQLAGI